MFHSLCFLIPSPISPSLLCVSPLCVCLCLSLPPLSPSAAVHVCILLVSLHPCGHASALSPPAQHKHGAGFVLHTPQQSQKMCAAAVGLGHAVWEGSKQPEHCCTSQALPFSILHSRLQAPLSWSPPPLSPSAWAANRMPATTALAVLEADGQVRTPLGLGSGRALSPAYRRLPSGRGLSSMLVCREITPVSPSSYKVTARWAQGPLMTSFNLYCFFKAHLQMPSYWGLVLQYMNWGGT